MKHFFLVALLFMGCAAEAPAVDAGAGEAGALDSGTTDAGSDAGTEVDSGCSATASLTLLPAGTDVLWVADRSGSLVRRADRRAGAGDAVRDAIAGWPVRHALSAFPVLSGGVVSCDVADHGLELGWGMTADAFAAAFAAHTLEGGSSLDVALERAIAAARAARTPGRSVSIVLITDASPSSDEACGSADWPRVAAIAATGPLEGVHVHVLSIVGGAVSPDHFGRIGAIATAGDGFAGIVNGDRSGVAASSATFLDSVRAQMEVCTFALPAGFAPDSVSLTRPDGVVVELARVAGPASCGPTGFYLDAAESTLTLCSGEGGIGGLCQQVYVSRALGAPRVTAACR